ncbi:MAG: HupE/UreJ family protein [Polyangiaceae bacterium]
MPRRLCIFCALCWLLLAATLLTRRVAWAHGLAMDQLILRPDFANQELRGQITFNPHRTRKDNAAGAAAIERDVLGALSEDVAIELDGKRCPIRWELRELWEPAGATVGDIVSLSCPLASTTHEMRVLAGAKLNALVVSVESSAGAEPSSHSVLISASQSTPAYRFGEAARDWRVGGANQFMPDGGLASSNDSAGAPAPPAPPTPDPSPQGFEGASSASLAYRYLVLGFRHILPLGADHVLFVAGLVLGSALRLRPLLLQLSAFTLAHTLTLGLGALGWVVLPSRVVEPLIAFSIAYVAFENLRGKASTRQRLLLVLGFGLLHGQGFASALSEAGLPRDAFLLSLLSFNGGVELGQLTVVVVLAVLLWPIREPARLRRYAVVPGSVAIAAIGVLWGVQRLLA